MPTNSDKPAAGSSVPARPVRRVNVQRAGLVFAVVTGLIGAGLVGIIWLQSRAGKAVGPTLGTVQPAGTDAPGQAGPAGITAGDGGDIATVGAVKKARVQLVDRNDPTRIAGSLQWNELDPLPGGRANVTQPKGFIFLKDGRVIAVNALRGTIFRPPRSDEPESGTFEGGVTVRLFEAKVGGANVETDTPSMVIQTQTLQFDRALYEVSTGDKWSLQSPRVKASGTGLRLVGNDVRERLELGELEQVDEVVYFLRPRTDAGAAVVSAATGTGKGGGEGEITEGPQALLPTMYRAQAGGDVRIAWGKRTLTGQLAEVWLRLMNNQLTPAALGVTPEVALGTATGTAKGAEEVDGDLVGPPATVESARRSSVEAAADQIRFTWTGRLVIRPLDVVPPALDRDDAAVRFSSSVGTAAGGAKAGAEGTGKESQVEFADAQTGISGSAAALTYGATTRSLALVGGVKTPVVINAGERSVFTGEAVSVNLGSGIGQARGAGSLRQRSPEEGFATASRARERTITWKNQADVEFVTRDGWVAGDLKRAAAEGEVVASDGKAEVSAGFVEALFAREKETAPMLLSRVSAREGAVARTLVDADASKHAELRATDLVLDLSPVAAGSTDVTPRFLSATGGVLARRGENVLKSEKFDVRLAPDAKGQSQPQLVTAKGNVRFTGPRGIDASADDLVADPINETATLLSPRVDGVRLSRQGGTVTGRQVKVDGPSQELYVFGPGALTFDRAAAGTAARVDAGASQLATNWTSEMRMSDKKGEAVLVGDVRSVWSSGATGAQRMWAERLDLSFTPTDEPTGKSAPDGKPEMRRRLVKATATGKGGGEGEGRARFESVRLAPGNDGQMALSRLVYLEGERIVASETDGTLEVPGAGRLLVDERKQASTAPMNAQAAAPAFPGDAKSLGGSSLFSWNERLMMKRTEGSVQIVGGTRLIHRPEERGGLLTIDADSLGAIVKFGESDLTSSAGAEFISATARGNVTAQGDDKKRVLADVLSYQAQQRILTAEGGELSRVTVFDPARATPVAAKKVVWNMQADRIEVSEPMPISAPK